MEPVIADRARSVGVVTCDLGPVTLKSNLQARGIRLGRNVASDDAWREIPVSAP